MPVVSMIYNRHGFYSPGAHIIYGRHFKPSVISAWAWVHSRRQEKTGGSDVLERVMESPSGRDGPM